MMGGGGGGERAAGPTTVWDRCRGNTAVQNGNRQPRSCSARVTLGVSRNLSLTICHAMYRFGLKLLRNLCKPAT
jgi:hypothetical protein